MTKTGSFLGPKLHLKISLKVQPKSPKTSLYSLGRRPRVGMLALNQKDQEIPKFLACVRDQF